MQYGVDCIGVAVGLAILDDKGENLLVARRAENHHRFPGVWEFGGGKVEYGETFEESAKREAMEEMGIAVEVFGWTPPTEFIKPDTHFIATMAVCRIIGGEPKVCEPDKCEELRWVPVGEILSGEFELAEYCHEDIKTLKKYLEQNNVNL